MNDIKTIIEQSFNIKVKDINIWKQALSHSSFTKEFNNQRLEFLGDAVLGIIIAEYLFEHYEGTEGILSEYKAKLVSKNSCIIYMNKLGMKPYILLNKKTQCTDSIVADTFEAILGAMLIEQNFENTKKIFLRVFAPEIDQLIKEPSKNYKGLLQDYAQKEKLSLSYEIINISGKDHNPKFTASLTIAGQKTTGEGGSKKEAEQAAAAKALENLSGNV